MAGEADITVARTSVVSKFANKARALVTDSRIRFQLQVNIISTVSYVFLDVVFLDVVTVVLGNGIQPSGSAMLNGDLRLHREWAVPP
ncbi:MAG: hypothetical protein AAF456_12900 [Planctomycetota bacterium]